MGNKMEIIYKNLTERELDIFIEHNDNFMQYKI